MWQQKLQELLTQARQSKPKGLAGALTGSAGGGVQMPPVASGGKVSFKGNTSFQGIDPDLQSAISGYADPLTVTSGYRDAASNAAVGGVPGSYHTKGQAADLRIRDKTPEQISAMTDYFSSKGYKVINEGDHLHLQPGGGASGGNSGGVMASALQAGAPSSLGGGGGDPGQPTKGGDGTDIQAVLKSLGYGEPTKTQKTLGKIQDIGGSVGSLLAAIGGDNETASMLQQQVTGRQDKRDANKKTALGFAQALLKPPTDPSGVREFEYLQGLDPEGQAAYYKMLGMKAAAKPVDPMKQMMSELIPQMMGGGVAPTQTTGGATALTPRLKSLSDKFTADPNSLTDEEMSELDAGI